jgi:hypothetical protein
VLGGSINRLTVSRDPERDSQGILANRAADLLANP